MVRPMPRPLLLAVALVLAGPPVAAAEITVFAAASLKTAMDRLAPLYEAETGDTAVVALAGSSALARQIQRGAPADVFVSANAAWMDVLEAEGRIVPGSRRDLLGNRLVLVATGAAAPLDLADLPRALGQGRLAMALHQAVPAGIYGRAALETLGLWDELAPRVAQADNVRAALALVAAGAAPYGIVYATDAAAEPRVSVVATFPAASLPPIVYPAALVAGADPAAAAFLDWLEGPEAGAVFADLGFAAPPG